MEGGLLSGLLTSQAPAAAAIGNTPAPAERSDSAGAIADCIRDSENLLRLGIPRDGVVRAMKDRYVGIAHVVDSIVPMATAPAVNSGPPPGATTAGPPTTPTASGNVDLPVEKPKAPKASKAKEGTTVACDMGPVLDHIRALVLNETDAGKAVSAALTLVNVFKAL